MSNLQELPLPGVGAGAAPGADSAEVGNAADVLACCTPPLSREPIGAEDSVRVAAMFKALGDPVRLRLFSLIASHEGGEACVCDVQDVGVSQPTVSHHLKKLRDAGLVTSERRGSWVYYKVAPAVVAALSGLLDVGVRR
ncbi:ArsR/SmtB family transcription factor [Streptodolium elevatio]|uniref:Metalloregulator ArsR/SmtB family transcription factor n=1 Tax=Streptodolium elevatio TaxID=3157996 RepID=A0ABV3DJB3_9ACTN